MLNISLVAVKRIREIMAGADINVLPPSQPQKMPVTSPAATPAFNQPSPMFDRQPLPPGVRGMTLNIDTIHEIL